MTSEELMVRIKKGDVDAFESLYRQWHGKLAGFLSNNGSRAPEELAQEVMLLIWRKASSFREGAKFDPWLYRISRNKLTDQWRKPANQVYHDSSDQVTSILTAEDGLSPRPANELESTLDAKKELAYVLKGETAESVMIITLRGQGFSYQEIKDKLKLPHEPSSIRMKVKRIRERMAKRRARYNGIYNEE